MSNVYINEPPCSGKVILHTTYGQIEVELWTKECPKTCKSFIRRALLGEYNGTAFHRIVPGFCIQGGKGSAEQLDDGNSFLEKELHSRLRFTRRGLLGAVSHTNRLSDPSQFFITLGPAVDLTNECTLFGKVVGDTLFNVVRIGEVPVEDEDKPVFEVLLTKVEVTQNPFDDLEGTTLQKRAVNVVKTKSGNPKLVSFDTDKPPIKQPIAVATAAPDDALTRIQQEKDAKIAALKASIAQMQAKLHRGPETHLVETAPAVVLDEKPKSKVEQLRAPYARHRGTIIGKRRPDSEAVDTMLTLHAFRQRLHPSESQQQTNKEETVEGNLLPVELCKLHGLFNCKSCRDTFGLTTQPYTEEGWMLHRLVFDKTEVDHQIRRDLNQLVVLDPKVEIDKLRRRAAMQ